MIYLSFQPAFTAGQTVAGHCIGDGTEFLVHRGERKIHRGAEPCESSEMAQAVSLLLSAQHCADLQGVVKDRGRPVKHVQRAQIILLSAERLRVLEIAKRIGISRPMVWRWALLQRRSQKMGGRDKLDPISFMRRYRKER
jgi:hypothetical protein